MFKIEVDYQKNTIELHFKGHFSYEQGRQLYAKLFQMIFRMKPGFKLLTDLSELEIIDVEAHKSIDDIMELCSKCGVSRIIRVITKNASDIGFNIMSLFHYSHSVIIHTCDSLQEAKHALKEE